ncbi:DUF1294 domain-containing protein [Colwellia sp. MB02u-10]|nr:DUF1294 domain-containing protein [Colwellia sp. MB02u-10]
MHLFSILGGWPSAAIAQQVLRHKSQEQELRSVLWFTVVVNVLALGRLLFTHGQNTDLVAHYTSFT